MTFNELTAFHASHDLTDKKARRALYAAMMAADADTKREFTCYLTERGAMGAA